MKVNDWWLRGKVQEPILLFYLNRKTLLSKNNKIIIKTIITKTWRKWHEKMCWLIWMFRINVNEWLAEVTQFESPMPLRDTWKREREKKKVMKIIILINLHMRQKRSDSYTLFMLTWRINLTHDSQINHYTWSLNWIKDVTSLLWSDLWYMPNREEIGATI